jgi:hypothetical protein
MTLPRLTTRLQRLEQMVARQAQHASIIVVEWWEAAETYDDALARCGVDRDDETQLVVVLMRYA